MIDSAKIGPAIALGARSYISSDYIYHNFINKKEGGFLHYENSMMPKMQGQKKIQSLFFEFSPAYSL
jgi:hypothetical protein